MKTFTFILWSCCRCRGSFCFCCEKQRTWSSSPRLITLLLLQKPLVLKVPIVDGGGEEEECQTCCSKFEVMYCWILLVIKAHTKNVCIVSLKGTHPSTDFIWHYVMPVAKVHLTTKCEWCDPNANMGVFFFYWPLLSKLWQPLAKQQLSGV